MDSVVVCVLFVEVQWIRVFLGVFVKFDVGAERQECGLFCFVFEGSDDRCVVERIRICLGSSDKCMSGVACIKDLSGVLLFGNPCGQNARQKSRARHGRHLVEVDLIVV